MVTRDVFESMTAARAFRRLARAAIKAHLAQEILGPAGTAYRTWVASLPPAAQTAFWQEICEEWDADVLTSCLQALAGALSAPTESA